MSRRRQRLRDKRRQHAVSSRDSILSLLYDVGGHSKEHRHRYAKQLHKISRRHRLRFSQHDKEIVCRSCSSLLIAGQTRRIRLRNGMKIIHCMQCGAVRRIPYKQIGEVMA
ncbi:MAG: hypothetical protein ACPIBN_06760 [Candidatus Poseidoniaceae archaeon]